MKALSEDYTGGGQKQDLELPFFSFSELSKFTNNFSINNKVGEGGFGTVYKVTYSCICVLYHIEVCFIRQTFFSLEISRRYSRC